MQNESSARRPAWQWIWPLLIATMIVTASSRSKVAAPHVTDIDKLAHFGAYGLLATLVCRMGAGWRAAAGALVAASFFGMTDEWHQSFVPGRSPDVWDWVADTLGAVLAVSLYAGWPFYRRLLEHPLFRRRIVVQFGAAPSRADPIASNRDNHG